MLQRGQILEKTFSYLPTDIDRTQQFYMLLMIHKNLQHPLEDLLSQALWVQLNKYYSLWITLLTPWYPSLTHISRTPPI